MRLLSICALAAVSACQSAAQTTVVWDVSGNSMLKGAYSFREVAYIAADAYGDIGRAIAVSGTITFDGQGTYNVSAQILDTGTSATTPQPFTASGMYGISASGWGFVDSLLTPNEVVAGLVSQGVFIGSNTNSQYLNDLFVSVPAAPASITAAQLNGTYWIAAMNFPSYDPSQAQDALFPATADGNGNLTGTITASGYIGASGNTQITQSIQGAHYSVANGVATLSFPAGSTPSGQILISGDKQTYLSADGNFLVGGSTSGFDFLVGVRAGADPAIVSTLQGLYYLAGLSDDESAVATLGYAQLYGYYGSTIADGKGGMLRHQQISPFDAGAYDFLTDDQYHLNSDGSFEQSSYAFGVGAGGGAIVGIAKGPLIGVMAGVRSVGISGTGVFLNPAGIVSAASSSPFTAGIVRGELLSLYGSNLAPSVAAAGVPFPTTLNGVQVLIDNRPAPICYVSPGQLSVVVPYATEFSIAQVQVVNNGTSSNTVTTLVKNALPGLFTVPPGGIGYGAILHSDYSLVTTDHPAKAGETVLIYLTGLGDVSPAVPEGTAAPSSPPSNVVNTAAVYFSGPSGAVQGAVAYAGLAPGFAGLYQINAQVPTTLTSGNYYVEVATPTSYSTQATIPVQ